MVDSDHLQKDTSVAPDQDEVIRAQTLEDQDLAVHQETPEEKAELDSAAIATLENPEAIRHPEHPPTPEQVRDELMVRFTKYVDQIKPMIEANRGKEGELKSQRLAVVVSLWEEDESLIASKMFKRSLTELVKQAKDAGLQLDLIMVANSGGGKTEAVGQQMKKELTTFFHEQFGPESLNKVTPTPPENPDATTPWEMDLNMDHMAQAADANRYILVDQPKHMVNGKDVNAGKLRALRDVSHALAKEMKRENGYAPDAIFQMDAETILEYAPGVIPSGQSEPISPLKVLYNNITRRDLVAVGTKDRFEPMDPQTGKPLDIPRPAVQEGYMLENQNKFITLPGGALMAKPEYYVGGMQAISETVPGCGVEDYLFTNMVHDLDPDKTDDIRFADSLNIVRHLNRCPTGPDAIKQMERWKMGGRAVDLLFPGHPYNPEPLTWYSKTVLKSRFANVLKGDVRFARQVLQDLLEIKDVARFLSKKDIADIRGGDASWEHKTTQPASQAISD